MSYLEVIDSIDKKYDELLHNISHRIHMTPDLFYLYKFLKNNRCKVQYCLTDKLLGRMYTNVLPPPELPLTIDVEQLIANRVTQLLIDLQILIVPMENIPNGFCQAEEYFKNDFCSDQKLKN